jgi:3-hydroxyisobutyrate dehydrogenase-like beta-hydroxyacid dehydrogenase
LKFIANLLVTIHNLSTAEAFVLAECAGVDTELMYRVIKDGAGTSRMFEVRGPLMIKANYLPATMKVDVYQKDIAIIRAFAAKLKCPTPLFALSKRYYDRAYQDGFNKHDTAAVHAVLRKDASERRKRR